MDLNFKHAYDNNYKIPASDTINSFNYLCMPIYIYIEILSYNQLYKLFDRKYKYIYCV